MYIYFHVNVNSDTITSFIYKIAIFNDLGKCNILIVLGCFFFENEWMNNNKNTQYPLHVHIVLCNESFHLCPTSKSLSSCSFDFLHVTCLCSSCLHMQLVALLSFCHSFYCCEFFSRHVSNELSTPYTSYPICHFVLSFFGSCITCIARFKI